MSEVELVFIFHKFFFYAILICELNQGWNTKGLKGKLKKSTSDNCLSDFYIKTNISFIQTLAKHVPAVLNEPIIAR